jgi:hypothetical protein
MFFDSLHSTGGSAWGATPLPSGPRHCGQSREPSLAAADDDAREASPKTRASTSTARPLLGQGPAGAGAGRASATSTWSVLIVGRPVRMASYPPTSLSATRSRSAEWLPPPGNTAGVVAPSPSAPSLLPVSARRRRQTSEPTAPRPLPGVAWPGLASTRSSPSVLPALPHGRNQGDRPNPLGAATTFLRSESAFTWHR